MVNLPRCWKKVVHRWKPGPNYFSAKNLVFFFSFFFKERDDTHFCNETFATVRVGLLGEVKR